MPRLNEAGRRYERERQKLREKYKPKFDVEVKRDYMLYVLENIEELAYKANEPALTDITNGIIGLGETFTKGEMFQLFLDLEDIYEDGEEHEEMFFGIHAILMFLDLGVLYCAYGDCNEEYEYSNRFYR